MVLFMSAGTDTEMAGTAAFSSLALIWVAPMNLSGRRALRALFKVRSMISGIVSQYPPDHRQSV